MAIRRWGQVVISLVHRCASDISLKVNVVSVEFTQQSGSESRKFRRTIITAAQKSDEFYIALYYSGGIVGHLYNHQT